jgi:hypothetical protein
VTLVLGVATMKNKEMKITYITNRIILAAIVILCLSSCRKDVIDYNPINKTTVNGNSIKINEDDLLRKVTISTSSQNVKTSTNGTVLNLVYTENINVLLDPKGYDLSYSIRFNEDFSASALGKLSYTLLAPNGAYTTNWAGNDLKVLTEVTKTEVTISGKPMVNLHLIRYFTFTKNYATAQEAVTQQNALLNTKTDVVKFTSYVVFGKEYPATTFSSALVYTK